MPDRCGYTVTDRDGIEQPCDRPATGWRWYQDVEHEDCLDVACDWHANEGGRRIHDAEAEAERLRGLLAEAEAGRDRANQRLGNLTISLNDSLTPEIVRQKADAWDECRAWEREKARHERRWNETEGEYVPPHQFHDDDYNPYRGQP